MLKAPGLNLWVLHISVFQERSNMFEKVIKYVQTKKVEKEIGQSVLSVLKWDGSNHP